jgi:hypothetical protein
LSVQALHDDAAAPKWDKAAIRGAKANDGTIFAAIIAQLRLSDARGAITNAVRYRVARDPAGTQERLAEVMQRLGSRGVGLRAM